MEKELSIWTKKEDNAYSRWYAKVTPIIYSIKKIYETEIQRLKGTKRTNKISWSIKCLYKYTI